MDPTSSESNQTFTIDFKYEDQFHYTLSSFVIAVTNEPPFFVTSPKDHIINTDQI